MCWLSGWRVETSLLDYPKHITYVLHHDPGDVGHSVDVMFGVIGEAGAGDEVKVFEDGVEAFGEAGVEFAQWGIGVDQEDRVVGGGVGHVRVMVERFFDRHGLHSSMGREVPPFCCETNGWQLYAGSQTGEESNRQTRRSPTHSRHKMKRWRILPHLSFSGVCHF